MTELSGTPTSARDRILQAAERVVMQVGAAHLTLEAVAHAAQVSKGGLLYHFPSKELLFVALAQRYVDNVERCVAAAKERLAADDAGCELKACVLGMLDHKRCSRELAAALLATAANDPALLQVIRDGIARRTDELAQDRTMRFARAQVVALAIDGLMMRESLRISTFTDAQRELVVAELMRIADEACESSAGRRKASRPAPQRIDRA